MRKIKNKKIRKNRSASLIKNKKIRKNRSASFIKTTNDLLHVQQICNSVVDRVDKKIKDLCKSLDRLWQNQQAMNDGLRAAEEQVMLIRRVLNDTAKSNTARSKLIDIKEAVGCDVTKTVAVIDWDWYIKQLVFCDNKLEFMDGTNTTEEDIERKAKEQAEKIAKDNLDKLDKITTAIAQKRTSELLPLLNNKGQLCEKIKDFINGISGELLETAYNMLSDKLIKLHSQKAIKRITNSVEFYDDSVDVEQINKVETFPEGAEIFGGD
jgi:hypothetical protein